MIESFDFKNPDYVAVFKQRAARIAVLRAKPGAFETLKKYYRSNVAQFITDWGCTFDPRNPERGLPSLVPFILFPRQIEWVEWFVERWRTRSPGLTEKSREMGVSWLSVAVAVAMCVLNDGVVAGFGSRKEEYVDKTGDPKSLFHKARQFISFLPSEFRAGCVASKHAPHMRIIFPGTSSMFTGEAGDNLGRGGRTSFYMVDEAAWLEHPELVDAALSETTNCRIDISTPRGRGNPFARKRFGLNVKSEEDRVSVFTFHWRSDPRKDDKWYQKRCRDIGNPAIIAQELDLDYDASVEGVVIPAPWVRAAIDAHIKLGVTPTGIKLCGFDVADEGADLCAYLLRYGILVRDQYAWRGKGADIFDSVEKTFNVCGLNDTCEVVYDADGVGAGVKGDARKLNESREREISVTPYHGGGGVRSPDKKTIADRANKDFFANLKAQSWWALRERFLKTYRAVVEGQAFDPDEIISISSSGQMYERLVTELSQATYSQNAAGKILIDKKPDGTQSPNLADACVMAFADVKKKGLFYV